MAETARAQVERSPWQSAGPSNAFGYLVALAIVGSTLQAGVQLPNNLLPVDVLLFLILGITLVPLLTTSEIAAQRFRRVLPLVWLLLLGQLLSLLGRGLSVAAVVAMGKIHLPVAVFFGVWLLLARWWRWQVVAIRTIWLTGALVAVSTFLTNEARARGTLESANYAGHFLACVIVALWVLPCRRFLRVTLTLLLLAAVFRTGSFGAIAFLATAAAYWLWGRSAQYERSSRAAIRLVLVLGFVVAAPFVYQKLSTVDFDAGSTVTSQRLDRSSASRFELWSEGFAAYEGHPLGVGIRSFVSTSGDGSAGAGYNELHNDAIKFLVETGPLALVGAIGIILMVWVSGRAGGPTRVMLTGLIASGMVREVWSFRHAWLILAVVAAWETAGAMDPEIRRRLRGRGREMAR